MISNTILSEIEFVDFDGTALSAGITRTAGTGDDFQLQIASPTYSAFKYRLVASPNTYGMIYLDDNTADYNFVVTKNNVANTTDWTYSNGVISVNTNALATDDVWEVTWHSDSTLSDSADGEFMPAGTHIYNPQNKNYTASFGDMIEHMRDLMTNMPDLQAITLVITTTTNVQEYTNMAALLGNNRLVQNLLVK